MQFKVTRHALARVQQRFPGSAATAAEIISELEAAFHCGRVSPQRPQGLRPGANPHSLYAWTEDGGRVYALRPTATVFLVTTCMRAAPQQAHAQAA